jgi:hypothetical protein
VLDIGFRYTKFGVSKDNIPKGIMKTPLKISALIHQSSSQTALADSLSNSQELYMNIEEFLTTLFSLHAKVDMKGMDIIVLESLLYPRAFTSTLAKVLFERFNIE